MARWRTHNKRARRKRQRDAEFLRSINKVVAPALEEIIRDAFRAAFADLAERLNQFATAWAKIGEERSRDWLPLDPRYAGLRHRQEKWPEVVLEDILDAEYVE
jgi:hypothetical protein